MTILSFPARRMSPRVIEPFREISNFLKPRQIPFRIERQGLGRSENFEFRSAVFFF